MHNLLSRLSQRHEVRQFSQLWETAVSPGTSIAATPAWIPHVSPRVTHALSSGSRIRIYNLLSRLSQRHEVRRFSQLGRRQSVRAHRSRPPPPCYNCRSRCTALSCGSSMDWSSEISDSRALPRGLGPRHACGIAAVSACATRRSSPRRRARTPQRYPSVATGYRDGFDQFFESAAQLHSRRAQLLCLDGSPR